MKISSLSLLDELKRPEYAAMKAALSQRRFVRGETLAHPDPSENLVFVVETGRVRVFRAYEEKEFTFAILEPGDIYSTHTGAHVVALSSGTLLVTDIVTFQKEMLQTPAVALSMVRVLGGLLKNAFQIIDGLLFSDSSARLASFLLTQSKQEPDGQVVHLPMTIEELARHLGMSRQTASTLLSDMARAGIITKIKRGRYLIHEPHRLREMAGQGSP